MKKILTTLLLGMTLITKPTGSVMETITLYEKVWAVDPTFDTEFGTAYNLTIDASAPSYTDGPAAAATNILQTEDSDCFVKSNVNQFYKVNLDPSDSVKSSSNPATKDQEGVIGYTKKSIGSEDSQIAALNTYEYIPEGNQWGYGSALHWLPVGNTLSGGYDNTDYSSIYNVKKITATTGWDWMSSDPTVNLKNTGITFDLFTPVFGTEVSETAFYKGISIQLSDDSGKQTQVFYDPFYQRAYDLTDPDNIIYYIGAAEAPTKPSSAYGGLSYLGSFEAIDPETVRTVKTYYVAATQEATKVDYQNVVG